MLQIAAAMLSRRLVGVRVESQSIWANSKPANTGSRATVAHAVAAMVAALFSARISGSVHCSLFSVQDQLRSNFRFTHGFTGTLH